LVREIVDLDFGTSAELERKRSLFEVVLLDWVIFADGAMKKAIALLDVDPWKQNVDGKMALHKN
jgi:hypothetical protein